MARLKPLSFWDTVPHTVIHGGTKRRLSKRERKWEREKTHSRRRRNWSRWPRLPWPTHIYMMFPEAIEFAIEDALAEPFQWNEEAK